MGKVCVHVLPALADALGIDEATEEVIPEQGIDGNYSLLSLLERLSAKYQRFGQSVYDAGKRELTGQVMIFLNGRHVELIDGLATSLSDGDELTFIPFVEGG